MIPQYSYSCVPLYRDNKSPNETPLKASSGVTLVFDTCSILDSEFPRTFLALSASMRNGTLRVMIPRAVMRELGYIAGASAKDPSTAAKASAALDLLRSASAIDLFGLFGDPNEVVSGDWAILRYASMHLGERIRFVTEDKSLQADLRSFSAFRSVHNEFEVCGLRSLSPAAAPVVRSPAHEPAAGRTIRSILRRFGIDTNPADHTARFA